MSHTLGLLAHYEAADAASREAGRRWYPEARALCEEIGAGRIPIETVARVMALLSPRVRWSWCIEWTRQLVRAWLAGDPVPAVSTVANRMKAWRELEGERAISGQKVTTFARAILGDEEAVTIDSWTLRTVGLKPTQKVTRHRQRWITHAYAEAAALVGETPRDMQAILWCHVREASI